LKPVDRVPQLGRSGRPFVIGKGLGGGQAGAKRACRPATFCARFYRLEMPFPALDRLLRTGE